MSFFGRSKKDGCCTSGSLVPTNETAAGDKKEEGKTSSKCCDKCC